MYTAPHPLLPAVHHLVYAVPWGALMRWSESSVSFVVSLIGISQHANKVSTKIASHCMLLLRWLLSTRSVYDASTAQLSMVARVREITRQ